MAADIYKRKGVVTGKKKKIERHNVYCPHNLPDSVSQFQFAKHKTSQVKPSKLKYTFTSIILWSV